MNGQSSSTSGFVPPDDLAEQLGVTRATVLRWARKGDIPSVKLGRRILIPADALEIVLSWSVNEVPRRRQDKTVMARTLRRHRKSLCPADESSGVGLIDDAAR